MASQHESQTFIKDEMFEDWNLLPQYESLHSSVDMTDSYEEFKGFSFSAIKEEESQAATPLPDPLSIAFSATVQAPALVCQDVSTRLGIANRQEVTFQKSRVPNDLFMVKKLLQLTLPKKHAFSRWTKQTTESILVFLKSFVTFAQGHGLTHSADTSLALKGPRILKCEECFLEFSGLYDRYLKLFTHYKVDHRLKCNMLIGRKWIKHEASLGIMVQAWKLDLRYDLHNLSIHTVP